MKFSHALILAVICLTTGCASPRYFGDGKYASASYDKPEHWDDRFNEFDSQKLITSTLEKLSACEQVRKSKVVMISRFDNQTSEALDLEALQRELVDQLSSSGYLVIDKTSRPDLHAEYEYNKTGYVNPAKAARIGQQEGVQLVLRAAIESKVQTLEDEKTVRYRFSIQAVDAESALVKCAPSTEIKKHFERVRASL